jgi:hypothetical protein
MGEFKLCRIWQFLVVVVILFFVVAAILFYRTQDAGHVEEAYDAAARSALRNAATGQEYNFIHHGTYLSCKTTADCIAVLPGLDKVSDSVFLSMTGTTQSFTGKAYSTKGKGFIYYWGGKDWRIRRRALNRQK